jgi:hypothetical protein
MLFVEGICPFQAFVCGLGRNVLGLLCCIGYISWLSWLKGFIDGSNMFFEHLCWLEGGLHNIGRWLGRFLSCEMDIRLVDEELFFLKSEAERIPL